MSLTFGGATSDTVSLGAGTGMANLANQTYLAWVMPTTLTSGRRFFSRSSDAANHRSLLLSGATGNLQWVVIGSTSTNFITNDTPLATLNKWYLVAVTFSTSPATHIYTGTLTTAAVESTYGTSTAGSGFTAETTNPATAWGNRGAAGPVNAFQGLIATCAIFDRVMTLAEIIDWQFNPRRLSGCVNYMELGYNGTGTQPDYSGNGNSGTVTGATQSAHVPLKAPFRSRVQYLPVVVSAGGSRRRIRLVN